MKLLAVLLLVIYTWAVFMVGWETRYEKVLSNYYLESDNYTKEQVIAKLVSGRESHQYYLDHPEKVNLYTGSVEANEGWVDFYTKLIEDYGGK